MNLLSGSAEKTIKLGECIGRLLEGGELLKLTGELGGGKTQITKGIAKGLGVVDKVVSPTFTIERIYKAHENSSLELHHFDFYRLSNSDIEISQGLNELIASKNNIIVVEWPENIKDVLPSECLRIEFEYVDDETRKISISAKGEKYEKLLERINDTCN